MKKISLILLFIIGIFLVSCSNKQIDITELYGKYQYGSCVYISSESTFTTEQQNKLYQGVSRYSFKEDKFTYYETKSTEETFSINKATYEKVNVNESLSKEDQKLLRIATTRYDIYKNDKYQSYSILYGKDKVYFMETRYSYKTESIVIWQIIELKKLD